MKCRRCAIKMHRFTDGCFRCPECGHDFDPMAEGGVWSLMDRVSGKFVVSSSWDEGRGVLITLTDRSRPEGVAAKFQRDAAAALTLCLNTLGVPGSFEAVEVA